MSLWLTLEEAEEYFDTRLGADAWNAAGDTTKLKAIKTGQVDLMACPDFTFDADADVTAAQQEAVCEQALFLLANPDMESRIALQAQGVLQAGIIQETYSGNAPDVVVAARARQLLRAGGFAADGVNSFSVER